MRVTLIKPLRKISFIEVSEMNEFNSSLLRDAMKKSGLKKREILAREVLIDTCLSSGKYKLKLDGKYCEGFDRKTARKYLEDGARIYTEFGKELSIKNYIRFIEVDGKLVFYSHNTGFVFKGSISDLINQLIFLKISAPKRIHRRIDKLVDDLVSIYSLGSTL